MLLWCLRQTMPQPVMPKTGRIRPELPVRMHKFTTTLHNSGDTRARRLCYYAGHDTVSFTTGFDAHYASYLHLRPSRPSLLLPLTPLEYDRYSSETQGASLPTCGARERQ